MRGKRKEEEKKIEMKVTLYSQFSTGHGSRPDWDKRCAQSIITLFEAINTIRHFQALVLIPF